MHSIAAWLLAVLPAQEPPAEELLEGLRSDVLEHREDAERALKARGKAARPALEKAAKDPDVEVASRARRLLRQIELREKLPASLFEALPGLEERLSSGDDSEWARAFLEAVALDPESGKRRHPRVRNGDLDALAEGALRGARRREERTAILDAAVMRRLPSAAPALAWVLQQDADSGRAVVEALSLLGGGGANWDRRAIAADFSRLLGHEKLEVRVHAAAAHWLLGEPAPEVPALVKDRPPLDRANAVHRLSGLGLKQATPSLRAFLKDADDNVRAAAVYALAEVAGPEAAPDVRPLLRDPAVDVRMGAAMAMGHWGVKDSAPEVARLLSEKEPYVRAQAIQALAQLVAKEHAGSILPFLGEEDADLRREAAHALGRLRCRDAIPGLIRLLKDPDDKVPLAAAASLARLRAAGAVGPLAERLADGEPRLKRAVIRALVGIGSPEAAPALVKLAGRASEDAQTRADAIDALAGLGQKDQIPAFLRLAKERAAEPELRCYAIYALLDLGAREAMADLRELLRDPDDEVRIRAIFAIGEFGVREASKDLLELLGDGATYVRREAADALGRLGAREAVGPLFRLFQSDGSDAVLKAAADSLIRLSPEEAVGKWLELLQAEDSRVRFRAATALCRAGRREGVPVVLEAVADDGGLLFDSLNGVRQPDLWRRLRERRCRWELSDEVSLEEDPAVSRITGLPHVREFTLQGATFTLFEGPRQQRGSALYGFDEMGLYCVLEPDRVRAFTRERAYHFWRSWWDEERQRK